MMSNIYNNLDKGIVILKERPVADLRLFCFPFAGGAVTDYYYWLDKLPESIELCIIQLPGRGARFSESSICDFNIMINYLVNIITPLVLDKPYAFFGHSMGAIISFEVIRVLRRLRAAMPIHLFISGSRAPHEKLIDSVIHQLPDEEFIEKIKKYNGTSKEVFDNPELLQLVLPLLRADFAVEASYQYREEKRLDCQMSVFGGDSDEHVNEKHLSEWNLHSEHEIKLKMFEGDHFFIRTAREALIEEIIASLCEQV